MRIAFLGSGTFGLPSLRALVSQGQEVVLIVTQPDRPAGRGRTVQIGPVKRFARERQIDVWQPEDVNKPSSVRRIRKAQPEVLLVIAYGQKLARPLLELAPRGAVNLHGSLLPKYRGAAPVNWAVVSGETETGLTVIQMTEQMDAGDILGQRATAIGPDETAGELEARLADLGARLVTEIIRDMTLEELSPRRQNETQATRAPRLKKSDGLIPWDRTAPEVHNQIRGMTPWPGAFTHLPMGRGKSPLRLVIDRSTLPEQPGPGAPPGTVVAAGSGGLDVATGRGTVRLLEVTPAGKRTMAARDFVNGYPAGEGTRFCEAEKSSVS